MFRYISLFIFIASTLTSRAQQTDLNLVLHSGVSIPAFQFAAKNLNKGSFTLPGFSVSGEVNSLVYEKWGGFIQSGVTFNPVDVGSLGYKKIQADPFLQDVYIRSDPYRIIHLIAGPAHLFQVSNKLKLEVQLGAGVFFSSTPYQLYKPEYFFMGPPFFEITPSRDVSFAYNGSVRVIYDLGSCYQIGISSQLLHSKASFDFYSGNSIRTDVRNISLWNTSLTLMLKLFAIKP